MTKTTKQAPPRGAAVADLSGIEQRLEQIEVVLASLKLLRAEKYFYSTGEIAKRLGLSKWYVRRLCSLGQIKAEKHLESGRLLISATELERIETRRDPLKR